MWVSKRRPGLPLNFGIAPQRSFKILVLEVAPGTWFSIGLLNRMPPNKGEAEISKK